MKKWLMIFVIFLILSAAIAVSYWYLFLKTSNSPADIEKQRQVFLQVSESQQLIEGECDRYIGEAYIICDARNIWMREISYRQENGVYQDIENLVSKTEKLDLDLQKYFWDEQMQILRSMSEGDDKNFKLFYLQLKPYQDHLTEDQILEISRPLLDIYMFLKIYSDYEHNQIVENYINLPYDDASLRYEGLNILADMMLEKEQLESAIRALEAANEIEFVGLENDPIAKIKLLYQLAGLNEVIEESGKAKKLEQQASRIIAKNNMVEFKRNSSSKLKYAMLNAASQDYYQDSLKWLAENKKWDAINRIQKRFKQQCKTIGGSYCYARLYQRYIDLLLQHKRSDLAIKMLSKYEYYVDKSIPAKSDPDIFVPENILRAEAHRQSGNVKKACDIFNGLPRNNEWKSLFKKYIGYINSLRAVC